MKAIILKRYGGVDQLQLTEVPKPSIKPNELLISVKAVNIASGDYKINTLNVNVLLKPILRLVFGLFKPRQQIRGITASGVIAQLGSKVTNHQVGDEVYFINSMGAGCLADYVKLKDTAVMVKKPANMSFIEAAPIAFGAMSALHFINDKTIHKDQNVLIYGASGSVGSYALQIAKYLGAKVTAVSSQKNHQALLGLGADQVIDYKKTDISTLDFKYDLIFDAVGKIKKKHVKHLLSESGKFYSILLPTKEDKQRLIVLNQMIEAGKLKTLLDGKYNISQYKAAHQKVYDGHKVGNVVIEWV